MSVTASARWRLLILGLWLVLGPGSAAAAEESAAPPAPVPGTELTVRGTPGAFLRVDDKPVGRLPLDSPLVLPAGPHRFQLERQGRRFESDVLTIPQGRVAELSLTAGSAGTAVAVLSLTPMILFTARGRQLDEPRQQALRAAVQEAAQTEHSVLVPIETMALLQRDQPASCLTQPACQLRFAAAAEARLVLRLELPAEDPAAPPSDSSATLRGELVDVKTGQSAVKGEQPCGTSDAQLADAAQQLTRYLIGAAAKVGRGVIAVTSQPAGAQVTIDGQVRGTTPWEGPAFPGPHEVSIDKPDYQPHHAPINVATEQTVKLDVELTAVTTAPAPVIERLPAPPPVHRERRRRPLWRLISGGAAIGLGAVVTGLGIAGLTQDGTCADTPPPASGNCNYLYSTAGLGGAGVGIGLSLAAAGVVLMAVPAPQAAKADGALK